jgi:hypothetical protein
MATPASPSQTMCRPPQACAHLHAPLPGKALSFRTTRLHSCTHPHTRTHARTPAWRGQDWPLVVLNRTTPESCPLQTKPTPPGIFATAPPRWGQTLTQKRPVHVLALVRTHAHACCVLASSGTPAAIMLPCFESAASSRLSSP